MLKNTMSVPNSHSFSVYICLFQLIVVNLPYPSLISFLISLKKLWGSYFFFNFLSSFSAWDFSFLCISFFSPSSFSSPLSVLGHSCLKFSFLLLYSDTSGSQFIFFLISLPHFFFYSAFFFLLVLYHLFPSLPIFYLVM